MPTKHKEQNMETRSTLKVVAMLLSLIGLGASADTGQTTSTDTLPQTSGPAVPKVSVQLWSVQDDMKRDFKGTIKALAAMGFDGVEFAGIFGEFADDPAGLKQFLDENNLKVSAAHIHFDLLSPEKFDATVAFYRALGCDTLIEAMDKRAWDPEGVHQVVSDLNLFAEKLAPHGLSIGYHNHAQEFGDFQDSTYWDLIASSTSEDVVLQLDVGWVSYAGKDPVSYVKRYPGRTLTTHYKIRTHEGDNDITPIIGKDRIDWSALLAANVAVGGTKWIVVEQEEYPDGMTPLQSVKASKDGLDAVFARHLTP